MLTKQENNVWKLLALGHSAEEIADQLNIAANTARKHINNIKQKIGQFKSTELVAEFICRFYGESLSEFRKKVLATMLLCVFAIGFMNTSQLMRQPRRVQIVRREV